MRLSWLCVLGLLACGGKVVVDGSGAGGSGDGGSGPGPTDTSTSASGGCFFVPQPVGGLDPGECSGGVTSGGDCAVSCPDAEGNVYEVSCSESGCRCSYNFEVKCTCVVDQGSACASPCCPAPWIF